MPSKELVTCDELKSTKKLELFFGLSLRSDTKVSFGHKNFHVDIIRDNSKKNCLIGRC